MDDNFMIKRYTIGKLLYAVDDDRLRIYEGIIVGIKTRDHILVKTDKCNVIFEYDLLIDFKYSEKQVLIKTFMEHSVHESKIAVRFWIINIILVIT